MGPVMPALAGKRIFVAGRASLTPVIFRRPVMRWFKPLGIVFVPVSGMGWAVSLLALAFCTQVFFAVDHQSNSVSDTLYGVFPFWAPTLLGLAWIADRTGGSSGAIARSA
jgi:hypothetical protein